jgi:phosphatidylinositol glycan class N
VFLALGPTFIILTISYEGLFYIAISATLLTWVELECAMKLHSEKIGSTPDGLKRGTTANEAPAPSPRRPNDSARTPQILRSNTKLDRSTNHTKDKKTAPTSRPLHLADLRICIFFLFFLHSAFFSTGNIASISSFSLDAVYRLLPVFDPFSQAALLLFKILAPFVLVSANLGFLTLRLQFSRGSLFVAVTGLSEYLTLRFFWAVKDEGSWLEIGETISMFVISSALCVFVAGLEALSEVLVEGIEVNF